MDTVEITSEGAVVLLSRYDLAVLNSALGLIFSNVTPADFEAQTGSSFLETKRLFEKIAQTNRAVSET